MFLSIHDFIWLSKPHSCLECTQSADLQAVFKAQNNRLRLKGLFFVPISLIEFERIFTRASSYHGTINHLGCEEEYCREYYSLKTLSSVCPTNNYFLFGKFVVQSKDLNYCENVRFCPPTSLHAVHYTSFCIPTL